MISDLLESSQRYLLGFLSIMLNILQWSLRITTVDTDHQILTAPVCRWPFWGLILVTAGTNGEEKGGLSFQHCSTRALSPIRWSCSLRMRSVKILKCEKGRLVMTFISGILRTLIKILWGLWFPWNKTGFWATTGLTMVAKRDTVTLF